MAIQAVTFLFKFLLRFQILFFPFFKTICDSKLKSRNPGLPGPRFDYFLQVFPSLGGIGVKPIVYVLADQVQKSVHTAKSGGLFEKGKGFVF